MENIEQHIINKIDECIDTANPVLLLANPNNINLFIPNFCIDNVINHYNNIISNRKIERGSVLKYRGINVLLGYELQIILAHKDSPIHPHLINKVNL